jgi:phosphoribosylanthranilate isomerase
MTLVKICGITNLADALSCADAGADMLGFNFYPASPRYIAPEEARRIGERLPTAITRVGIFVNEESPELVAELARAARVSAVQLHGEETPDYCSVLLDEFFVIKALRVAPGFVPEEVMRYGTKAVLLDAFCARAYGGTGRTFDWSVASAARARVPQLFLSGGLGPENVSEAVAVVQPYAVDACSLLERAPGQKDAGRIRAFVAAARSSEPTEVKGGTGRDF